MISRCKNSNTDSHPSWREQAHAPYATGRYVYRIVTSKTKPVFKQALAEKKKPALRREYEPKMRCTSKHEDVDISVTCIKLGHCRIASNNHQIIRGATQLKPLQNRPWRVTSQRVSERHRMEQAGRNKSSCKRRNIQNVRELA
jgi:hypothetical protein